MNEILLFLILQLINVILSTVKSLLTIKGSKLHAALANSIYFGYYTFIVKAIGDAESFYLFGMTLDGTTTIAVITLITNFIGVYFSLMFAEKFRKDRLWLLKVTIKTEQLLPFIEDLASKNMKFIQLSSNWEVAKPVDIYLYSKEESSICKKIISKYDSIKYCSVELDDRIKL